MRWGAQFLFTPPFIPPIIATSTQSLLHGQGASIQPGLNFFLITEHLSNGKVRCFLRYYAGR